MICGEEGTRQTDTLISFKASTDCLSDSSLVPLDMHDRAAENSRLNQQIELSMFSKCLQWKAAVRNSL